MEELIYDYDEFFIPKTDPGVVVLVPINGREVPITLKRGLTLGDIKSAQGRAVIQRKNLRGEFEVSGFDEDIFTSELLTNAILAWPFKKNMGSREFPEWRDVPVTKDNVRNLLAEGAAFIQNYLLKRVEGAKNSAAPLENQSGAVS